MEKCLAARAEIIKETYNKNIECVECNLASLESINNFIDKVKKSK